MGKSGWGGAALMLAAAFMALAVAAAETRTGAQNSNSGTTQNSNGDSHAGHDTAGASADMRFATEAAMGGMEEVEMGRLAAEKGASDEVRQFGRRMVDDHSKANQELMQLASSKGWTLPAALGPKHQADVRKMSALSGEAFDKAYVKMMVKDHKKDVGEFQKESARGADPELKAFAASTLPTLQGHLQMIQRIDTKMKLRKSGNLKTFNSNGNSNTGSNANGNSNR
jgi:putative membrane protein